MTRADTVHFALRVALTAKWMWIIQHCSANLQWRTASQTEWPWHIRHWRWPWLAIINFTSNLLSTPSWEIIHPRTSLCCSLHLYSVASVPNTVPTIVCLMLRMTSLSDAVHVKAHLTTNNNAANISCLLLLMSVDLLTWTSSVVNLIFGIKLEIMTSNYNAKHMKWVKLQQASIYSFRGILEVSEWTQCEWIHWKQTSNNYIS